MKKSNLYTITVTGDRRPTFVVKALLDNVKSMNDLWKFADQVCDDKHFDKIAPLIVRFCQDQLAGGKCAK